MTPEGNAAAQYNALGRLLYAIARSRVLDDPLLAPHADFILTDWCDGATHLKWVIDTDTAEILEWVEAGGEEA